MLPRLFLLSLLFAGAVCNNQGWFFRKSVNGGTFVTGKHAVLEPVASPAKPAADELAVKVIATSVVPSYRGRMDPEHWPKNQADYPPFPLNEAFGVEVVFEVLESEVEGWKKGDRGTGFYPLIKLQNIKADGSDSAFKFPPTKLEPEVPTEKVLSVMSIAGGLTSIYITDYFDVGKVDAPCDKTVFITAAASTVGMIAGQLYKAKGCTVYGSTSTRAKADTIMKQGGFDAVIAYKEEDFETRLNELAPEGVDMSLENVGGPQMDAIIRNMKPNGKISLCGTVYDYNKPIDQVHGCRAMADVVIKRITIKGLLIMDLIYMGKLGEAIGKLTSMLTEGKLTSEETTIHGFDRWGEAMDLLLSSYNTGRLIVATDAPKSEL